MFRTQKANGLEVISAYTERIPSRLVLDASRVAISGYPVYSPMFARPCPVRPRHGFVDSRIIRNAEELKLLAIEVVEHDKDGEIMLMAPIQAIYSGVVTTNSCAVGPGNDGVTAGREGCIGFPIVKLPIFDKLCLSAKLEGEPYIEFVNDFLVQLRDGPKSSSSISKNGVYSQKKETVKRIIAPEFAESLIEWEGRVKSLGEGDAVWLPKQTMLSHYAVHAVCAGRPIFFGSHPDLPIEVEPSTSNTGSDEYRLQELQRGMSIGARIVLNDKALRRLSATVAIFAVHHGSALIQSPEGCFVIGLGAELMMRLGTAAIVAEWRHRDQLQIQRNAVYDKSFLYTHESQFDLVKQAIYEFEHKSWKSGFGGARWKECGFALINLAESMKKEPALVLGALNNTINAAHNNGKWLNKFIDTSIFTLLANGHLDTVIQAIGAVWKTANAPAVELHELNAKTFKKFFSMFDGSGASSDDSNEEESEPPCQCQMCQPSGGSPPSDESHEEESSDDESSDDESSDDESSDDEESNDNEEVEMLAEQLTPGGYSAVEKKPKPTPVPKVKTVQWAIRKGHLHFQLGRQGDYNTFDVSKLKEFVPLHEKTTTSFAGSSTEYRSTSIEKLLEQSKEQGITDLAQWLEQNK